MFKDSRNIIVNVVWHNVLTSMGDYVHPQISKYGHALEINAFILVNLNTGKDMQTMYSHLNLKVIWKISVNVIFHNWGKCDHVTLMLKLRPLSSRTSIYYKN